MCFLDSDTVNRNDPRIEGLHEILIRAYDNHPDALALASQVGIIPADIEYYPKLRLTWWSILEEVAKEHKLRGLVNMALRDPTRANWHAKICDITGLTDELPMSTPEQAEAAMTDAERRKASLLPRVGQLATLWDPGTTLSIRFLNGSAYLRGAAESAAMQWAEYANLNFSFDDDPDAPIRITFEGPGYWAYLAKDCLSVSGDQATANFAFDDDASRSEILPIVLHEFGHVLGLQHENSNPTSTLKWNRPRVYELLSGPPNYWSREIVDHNLFTLWPPGYFPVYKVFDRASIMMLPWSADYFVDGKAIVRNNKLSLLDKQFAADLYQRRLEGGR
jgi:hypothetical protein